MIERLKKKILNMIARSVIEAVAEEEDGTLTLKLDLLAGENLEEIELFQHYGIASVPLPGAEGLTFFLGGDRSHGITIATEDGRYRLKGMKGGEVALYTDEGDVIHLKRNRTIAVKTATLEASVEKMATIDTPILKLTGDLDVAGNITGSQVSDSVGKVSEIRSTYNSHTHAGVTTGPGSTGGPVPPVSG